MLNNYKYAKGPVNIVELEGTTGSAPAIDRKQGFTDVIKANPNLEDHRVADGRVHPRQGQGGHGRPS